MSHVFKKYKNKMPTGGIRKKQTTRCPGGLLNSEVDKRQKNARQR